MLFNYGNVLLSVCMVLSFLGVCGGFGLLYYGNVSLVILRKLSREPYVWIVFTLALSNMIIDCAMPFNAFSPIAGTMYFIAVCLVLTFDVVNTKSRALTVGTATVFMLVTLWNILRLFFGNVDAGVVLLKYGESYTLYKNSVKRSIYIEICLFTLEGIWTLITDKKIEKFMFIKESIYRETHTKEGGTDVGTTNQGSSTLSPNQVDATFSDGDPGQRRLSLVWGQRVIVVCILFCFLFFLWNGLCCNYANVYLFAGLSVFFVLGLCGMGLVCYRNVSYSLLAKLVRDINFYVVVSAGLLNFIVDCATADRAISPFNSLFYLIAVVVFLSMEILKTKSRPMVLTIGTIFLAIILWNIYSNVFGADDGIIVVTIGEKNAIYRRSMRRTIHLQIFLFSFEGLVTLFTDRSMKKLMFLKAPVYRKTGTTSKEVQRESFVEGRMIEMNKKTTLP